MSLQINRSAVAAGLQRAQPNIGSVPGIQVPTGTEDHKQMDERIIVLQSGVGVPIAIEGDYFIVQSSDVPFGGFAGSRPIALPNSVLNGVSVSQNDAILTVKTNNNDLVRVDTVGRGYTFPRPYRAIFLTYTAPSYGSGLALMSGAIIPQTVTIRIYAGYGRVPNDSGMRGVVGVQGVSGCIVVRPNNVTPYAANGIVAPFNANSSIFRNLARLPGMGGIITRASIFKNSNTTVNANFSLWLYQVSTFLTGTLFTTGADQSVFGAIGTTLQPPPIFQGIINFPTFAPVGGGNAALCDVSGINVPFTTDGSAFPFVASTPFTPAPPFAQATALYEGAGQLIGILVANAAYVPAVSEQFNITLFTDQY